jgi:hypothetical protein
MNTWRKKMGLEDALETEGFWILGGVGTAMVILGWIMSKKMDMVSLPLWQMAIVIAVIWIASAFFAGRD